MVTHQLHELINDELIHFEVDEVDSFHGDES